MGWDMSIKAQSRRALAISSVWLHEEGEGMTRGYNFGRHDLGWRRWVRRERGDFGTCIDHMFEVNLEVGLNIASHLEGES